MPGSYNSNANAVTLADQFAVDPNLKSEAWSRLLDEAATQHNAFAGFTTPLTPKTPRGVRSIFCSKRDLSKGGSDTLPISALASHFSSGREMRPLASTVKFRYADEDEQLA